MIGLFVWTSWLVFIYIKFLLWSESTASGATEMMGENSLTFIPFDDPSKKVIKVIKFKPWQLIADRFLKRLLNMASMDRMLQRCKVKQCSFQFAEVINDLTHPQSLDDPNIFPHKYFILK